jgi:hypothetical protein
MDGRPADRDLVVGLVGAEPRPIAGLVQVSFVIQRDRLEIHADAAAGGRV